MAYGSGSIYRRGRIWWISYMLNGEQQSESSRSIERKDAAALLKKRMGEIAANRAIGSARMLTVADLLTMLEEDYIEKERRSIADLRSKIAALKTQFGNVRASEFGTNHIRNYKAVMLRKGAANATVNRYLAELRRAFRLAATHDPPLVGRVPHFEMLPEDNVRTGFITDAQYHAILEWLPDHLKGMLIFGYHLGMRKTALKNLRREWVDWQNRVIRTEAPHGAKRQGKVLPIYGEMTPWLEMQMSAWPDTPRCAWIFHLNGIRIGDFRKSWATACKAAKVPDLLFHDLRRSAVRNMERAGIPRSQAMAITGHKTESVYYRYAIVSEKDVTAAGDKLGRFLEASRAETTSPPTQGETKQ